MQQNEQIFVEKVKRKDVDAQRAIYMVYAGRLLAISIRYVGSRGVAEDILHDSFIKIFKSIDRFKYRGEGSLRAWMERITINTALEWLRSQKRDIVLDETYIPANSESEPSPSDIQSISQEQLLLFVKELPDGYRTVFNLFCIEGYSHREIAKELGINEKSSSSQLLRAKKLLASRIKTYLEKHG
ncbi:MAG: RNA polymerase sigma factor [Rikenellaceae bacterium]